MKIFDSFMDQWINGWIYILVNKEIVQLISEYTTLYVKNFIIFYKILAWVKILSAIIQMIEPRTFYIKICINNENRVLQTVVFTSKTSIHMKHKYINEMMRYLSARVKIAVHKGLSRILADNWHSRSIYIFK